MSLQNILKCLMAVSLVACASHKGSRSLSSAPEGAEPTVKLKNITITEPLPITPINISQGKLISADSDNILDRGYSFYASYGAIEHYSQTPMVMNCNWPIKPSKKIRTLSNKDRAVPLAITSMTFENKPVTAIKVSSRLGGYWLSKSNAEAMDQVLVMKTTLESSPVITCTISDGERKYTNDYENLDKAMWVKPEDLEELFKVNGFLLQIPEDSAFEKL